MSLQDHHRIEAITEEAWTGLLAHYPTIVPAKAAQYDDSRYAEIPKTIAAREKSGNTYLQKPEVVTLVNWKLSHGTFRPKLKQLVESNPSDAVQKTTASAFSSFDGSPEKVKSCLAELSTLRGVGPATASLLLSVAFPEQVPFFSDEVFRWAFWEDGKGKGWDRPIKYTPKEYIQLYSKIQEVRHKHSWAAVDIEKTAFVLRARSKEKERSAVGSADSAVGKTLDAEKSGDRPTQKRAGSDADAASPPPTKRTKKGSASKVVDEGQQEKQTTVRAAKTDKVQSAGTRSSSRLKSKAS